MPPGTPALEGAFPEVARPSAGPYYMSDRLKGEYMILKRNPNYDDGPAPARFDPIPFREGLAPEQAVGLPVYALLSSRPGCEGGAGALDLAALSPRQTTR